MNCIFSLGSNIDNKRQNIAKAISAMKLLIGKPICESSLYESEPWGVDNQDRYYNQIIVLESNKTILELKLLIRQIEQELGRDHHKQKWSPRIIDIDLIYYGKEIFTSIDFHVPHKMMHLRNFVLLPLAEVLPSFIHPVFNKTSMELLRMCPDEFRPVKIE